MTTIDDLVDDTSTVHELPCGWDIGGGEGMFGKGCDGPLWLADGQCLAFNDVGHPRRLTWSADEGVMVLHTGTNKALGTARDAEGRIVACEYTTRRVTRHEHDGSLTVLAERVNGNGLSGPDDLVVRSDGSIYFTDVRASYPPIPGALPSAVYRVRPGGDVEVTSAIVDSPGGVVLSPDEQTLYVSDSATRELVAYRCDDDGSLVGGTRRVITVIGDDDVVPHGITADEHGNIYCGGPGGIWVVSPTDGLLGIIAHPATATTNLCFGGPTGTTLFFTTPVAVGYIDLNVRGASVPPASAPADAVALLSTRSRISIERRIERLDQRIDRIIDTDATVEELASGGVHLDLGGGPHLEYARSLEGTVWDPTDGHLFFSDIGNDRRLRWTESTGISVLHPHTNHTNGATLDTDGAIISAEHSGRRVSRLTRDGSYSIVATEWNGKQLGRPNDVVVRSDGNIYFTCPWWDFGAGDTSAIDVPTFYRVAPSGEVTQGPPGFIVPNGLAFSPDETVLYVNDSLGPNIRSYDVDETGDVDLESERIFFTFSGPGHGTPDGMKVDEEGNVYCGGPGGMWIIDPDGVHLGTIVHGATQVNNLCFGGPDRKTLYFCSWSALFRIPVLVAGAATPAKR